MPTVIAPHYGEYQYSDLGAPVTDFFAEYPVQGRLMVDPLSTLDNVQSNLMLNAAIKANCYPFETYLDHDFVLIFHSKKTLS
ncbi:MAG TPA: hypothetical protein EYH12_06370 [Psychromonas hadalis]|nr:hypothetical protein [Psychromonas hadalis]